MGLRQKIVDPVAGEAVRVAPVALQQPEVDYNLAPGDPSCLFQFAVQDQRNDFVADRLPRGEERPALLSQPLHGAAEGLVANGIQV